MKKVNLWMLMVVMALSACTREEGMDATQPVDNGGNGEKAKVTFEMNAAALSRTPNVKSISQQYGVDGLRILAFREGANGFVYIQDVAKKGWGYDSESGKFSGTSELPVGRYQFVAAYGIPAADIVTLSPIKGITEPLTLTHVQNKALPAIFLGTDANLTTYDLGLTSAANQKVTATVKRAVSRVDVLFIRRDSVTKLEKKGANVFGTTGLASIRMEFGNIQPVVSMIDGSLGGGTAMATSFEPNIDQAITLGNGEKTIFGQNKSENVAYDYEAIAEGDIIAGSAHLYGPFLFPNATKDVASTLKLTLTSKPDGDHTYTRNIQLNNVPLVRNTVTVVKIYVPGTDVFSTKVTYDVTVEKAWDGVLEVEDTLK